LQRTNTLVIKTPEGIFFPLWLAGPVTRFCAWCIDLVAILIIGTVAGAAGGILGLLGPSVAVAFQIVSYFVVSIGYGIATEWYWRGQTFGKRVLRLRVMDAQGLRLRPSQIVIRNLLRFVDNLPFLYLVGGVVCLLNRRYQRLGDIAADTIVVRSPKLAQPDLEQLMAGKYNSFRDHPHLEARLRQRVTPQAAAVALQAIIRRDAFEPNARVELFAQIAAHFRSLVEFPQEATEGITDEQYVRNVADLLFRSQNHLSTGQRAAEPFPVATANHQ
jgi:uncharacterized RDD family membrane protein YckC